MNAIMLGMALAVSGWVGADASSSDGMVSFRVRMMEMPGLGWRSAVYGQLEKVGDQNGATVWTGPTAVVSTLERMADGIMIAPRVSCMEGFEASLSTGTETRYVAYMHRRADGPVKRAGALAFLPEVKGCQDGLSAKLAGRCSEEGTLVRLNMEESQIAAIRSVNVKEEVKGTEENDFKPTTVNASYQVPELRTSRVSGEWLVPTDQVLVMSLGVRTGDGSPHAVRERVVVLEVKAGTETGLLPVPLSASEMLSKRCASGEDSGEVENKGSGVLTLVPMVSPVAGLAIAGLSAVENSPGRPVGPVDAGVDQASIVTRGAVAVVNGPPELPSRAIPQGYAASGEPVELPPLPPESTQEPARTAEPQGTPQSRAFRAPSAGVIARPVSAEPVPMAVSDLVPQQPGDLVAPATISRIELTGGVKISAQDGTVMEADSAVITTEPVSSGVVVEREPGFDLDFDVEMPERTTTEDRQAETTKNQGQRDQEVARTGAEGARTFVQRIPVLGGAIELKVRVSHGKEEEEARRP